MIIDKNFKFHVELKDGTTHNYHFENDKIYFSIERGKINLTIYEVDQHVEQSKIVSIFQESEFKKLIVEEYCPIN